jgi:hypothetical protein
MNKFEYGMAYYGAEGLLDAHPSLLSVVGANRSVGPFLQEAGENGWELCAVLPVKEAKDYESWVIFKRQMR